MERKKWTLATKEGCRRLLAIALCLVFLFSFFAQLVSSDLGKVKISHLTLDVRGGELDMDLYAPRGVKPGDDLPCVLLAHGRGATKNVMRGVAEELSRRGFVVLNVNAYGMGLSEQPAVDEVSDGAHFAFGGNSFGMLDALDYARSLTYVDATRIAMYGHSFGSGRSAVAAMTDCGLLSFNDIMINVLADTFGQSFTETEIAQDADTLAAARLNTDQLAYYENIRAEQKQRFDTRLNTIVLTGSGGQDMTGTAVVAGYEVKRECPVNVTFIAGKYDSLGAGAAWSPDGTQKVLGPSLLIDYWYKSENAGESFTPIGALSEVSITNSEALRTALAARTARIVCYNAESHSKNYFSSATTADAIAILQQALNYNRGELSANNGIAPSSAVWWLRATFNLLAMTCMLASLLFLVCLLLKGKYFADCIAPVTVERFIQTGSKENILFSCLAIVFTVLALLKANSGGPVWANPFGTRWFPGILKLVTTSAIAVWFVIWLALASLIILLCKLYFAKKQTGSICLKEMNLGAGWKCVGKTVLLSLIVLVFANAQLIVIERFFNQDFRFWQMMFGEVKIEQWLEVALPYVILFLPCYLVIGLAINHGANDRLPEGKDMFNTIVINSVGVWALCLFCYIMWFVNWKGAAISDFTLSYSMLLFVPMTVYVTRKMYKLTNSVWLGALLNSLLLAWTLTCSAGIADKYYGQSWLSVILGI